MNLNRKTRRERAHAKFQNPELPNTILIEMDGALIDSLPVLYKIYNDYLHQHSINGSKNEFNQIAGLPLPEFLLQLIEKYGFRRTLDGFLKEYINLLSFVYNADIPLLNNAQQFLTVAGKLGLTLGIVASVGEDLTLRYLHEKHLFGIFDVIATTTIEDVIPENIPNLYQKALTRLSTEPEDAIAIVSTIQGAEAAKEAGIPRWILSPHEKRTVQLENVQDYKLIKDWSVISSFFKLLE